MSNSSADRNLLIGVLALQMDFISRQQLVEALSAWVLDKSVTLDQILHQRGAVDDKTRPLLIALVDNHLRLHSGNATDSLASISSSSANSVDWKNEIMKELKDKEVTATLETLAACTIPLKPLAAEAYQTAGQLTSKGQRFRILRPHNAGAIGVVSVARDEEFGREVALKEIKAGQAHHPENRRRFLVEAEITGGLEHPGIVPVYGLGQYPDGRPYYAMRFIRGDSLQDAIGKFHSDKQLQADPRRRAVELRKLLRRMVDVCNAIEYAHSRGVLHRDLKPSNVMLGKYGETLVVDWGLAKAGDATEVTNHDEPLLRLSSSGNPSSTMMGACFGTPGFMSPEQSEGRLDLLKATSDVYSLGATLYTLLTGELSVSAKRLPDTLRLIRTGDFPRPRAHDSRIAPALEAICLKAMALKPADRYSSAAALAADLENWIADEPVTAFSDPWTTRISRWSRHHRALISSIGAATLASILILTVFIALLLRANGREHEARTLAEDNFNVAKEARELAENERQRAEENLKVAKQAVATMLTEVGREELAQLPQMEQPRFRLLKKARDFYEGFRDQAPTDPTVRLETSLAWRSLADIDRQSDNTAQAQKLYLTAIEQLRGLLTEFPREDQYNLALGATLNDVGWLLIRSDSHQAENYFGQAIDLLQPLSTNQRSPLLARELARSLYNRGLLRAEQARTSDAMSDYEEAIRIFESLSNNSEQPAEFAKVQQDLARTYNNLSNLLLAAQDLTRAQANSESAIQSLQKVFQKNPKDRDLIKELAIYENNLADLHRLQGQPHKADSVSKQSVERFTSLAQPLPFLASELANALHVRGTIHGDLKQPQDAEKDYLHAKNMLEQLVAEFPDVELYRDRLGNALFQLARLKFDIKKFGEGVELVVQAIQEHRAAREASPREPAFAQHLKNDYVGAALLLILVGDHARAFQFTEQLVNDFKVDADVLFDAAQLSARCLTAVPNNAVAEVSESELLRKKYRAASLSWLSAAEKAGFQSATKIDRSMADQQAFFPYKSDTEFQEILARMKPRSPK